MEPVHRGHSVVWMYELFSVCILTQLASAHLLAQQDLRFFVLYLILYKVYEADRLVNSNEGKVRGPTRTIY
jgi:hypothetical protein